MKQIEDFKKFDINSSQEDIDKLIDDATENPDFEGALITENGKAKGVLISAAEYNKMMEILIDSKKDNTD